ncbi:MAG: anaerobic ribonucleoside-triphosphate reductase, partial [Desulfatirhabdiaceae bacterium]
GGTVLHLFLGEQITDIEAIKNLIHKISSKFRLPYFTLTPTFSVCPSHGYIAGEQEICSVCDRETEVYSRVVGYLRPIKQWNNGKQAEYSIRKTFRLDLPDDLSQTVCSDNESVTEVARSPIDHRRVA